jgi:LysM repeat protein
VISLLIALIALGLGLWSAFSPSPPPVTPAVSPEVVLGGTAERVAKLEKDAGSLMLRLVTLEKELEALRGKAGALTKLTELSAKVAALQSRLDNLEKVSLEQKMAAMASKAPAPAKTAPPAQPEKKAAPAAEVKAKEPVKAAAPQTAVKPAEPAPKPAAKPAAEEKAKQKLTYVVRKGDTLFTVAQRYKVRMKDLMKWNDLKDKDVVKVGQKLEIHK